MKRATPAERSEGKPAREAEWHQVISQQIVAAHRPGWRGVWDSLVSAFTGQPRLTAPTQLRLSIWVKGDADARLTVHGAEVTRI